MKQESVWDYPRPPAVKSTSERIEIYFKNLKLVDTKDALRVLETSHPPTYYIPKRDIAMDYLIANDYQTVCEFKGVASYFDFEYKDAYITNAAWTYREPNKNYKQLVDHLCFYPSKMTRCLVDGEQVKAQEGDFYGGWITKNLKGPFKGGAGTFGW